MRLGLRAIFTSFLLVGATIVLPLAAPENDDRYLARIVISRILTKIPASTKKICVTSMAGSTPQKPKIEILRQLKIDDRIVEDASACTGATTSNDTTAIYYLGRIERQIEETQESDRPDLLENLLRVKQLLKSGKYIVVGAGIRRCGAEVEAFIFRMSTEGVELAEQAPIGLLKCVVEYK